MRGWVAYLMVWMAALCAAVPSIASGTHHRAASEAAVSRENASSTRCFSAVGPNEQLAGITAAARPWNCDGAAPVTKGDRIALRFPLGPDVAARFFGTRPTFFEQMTFAVIDDGRIIATRQLADEQLLAAHNGRLTLVPLPKEAQNPSADALIVLIDQPSTRSIAADAKLYASDPTVDHGAMKRLLLAAIVCGMLAMPLAFNIAYYRVLRERFVLWHMVVSAGLLTQCLLTSGILAHFFDVPVPVFSRLINVSFAMSVAAAAAFCAAFIEEDKLDPRLRLGLYLAGAQVLAVSLLEITFTNRFGPVQTILYYLSFLPVLFLFIAVMIDAARKGSRSVRYQIIGWTPFLAVGIIRIVTMVFPSYTPNEAMDLFYFAMIVETVATSLGVADRFVIIRRERDIALSRANSLEELTERDDLTGLYNRRALDGLFDDLGSQGFTGFALFDLDNFKRVNDTHGHGMGDAVLRTVGSVLASHENAVALRLGGEEFLLLLRGDNVEQRVERLREAIPVRIAREVTALELLVTSSAGLVFSEEGFAGRRFPQLYQQADDLLYEAKHNGRNLLASSKLEKKVAPPAAKANPVAA